jgi:hypothetical protein
MVNEVTGQSELALLGWRTANPIHRRGIISWHIVGMLKTQLRPKGDRTAQPEIEPDQVLTISGLVPRALTLEIVDVLVANIQ